MFTLITDFEETAGFLSVNIRNGYPQAEIAFGKERV
jgi:hypothetical protein